MGVAENDTIVKINQAPNEHNAAFAKLLAGNDKSIRDKGLKKLKKWLSVRSLGNYEFTENDLMTIWVGLYYSMWMSDMPLVQEDLAESLSSLVHCFNQNNDAALLFIKCFNATMNRTWSSLDQYRVDKFSMLVRRFLRQSFELLAGQGWPINMVRQLMKIYESEVLAEKVALGFKLHFIDIFVEEVAKVTKGALKKGVFSEIVTPFVRTAALTRDGRVRLQLESFFRHLIKQTNIALDHEEKFNAWRQAGFPGSSVNVMVREKDEDEEEDDKEVNSSDEDQEHNEQNGDEEVDSSDEDQENNEQNGDEEVDSSDEDQEHNDENDDEEMNSSDEDQEKDDQNDDEEMNSSDGDQEQNDQNDEGPLDPRAGSVHVILPQIKIPFRRLAKILKDHSNLPLAPIKGKRMMITLSRQFKKMARGRYPYPVEHQCDKKNLKMKVMVDRAARKLVLKELKAKSKKKGKPLDNKASRTKKQKSPKSARAKSKVDRIIKRKIKIAERRNKMEKEKSEISTDEGRKRKVSAAFTVSTIAEDPDRSPVGTRKRKHSEEAELELPPGWIVECCEEIAQQPKKRVLNSWNVDPLTGSAGKEETEAKVVSPKEVNSLSDNSSNTKGALTTPVKRYSLKAKSLAKDNSPKKATVKEICPGEKVVSPQRKENTQEKSATEPMEAETAENCEVDIVIENKRKSLPAFFAHAAVKAKVSPKTPLSSAKQISEVTSQPKSARRISFNLAKNMAQEKREYFEQLERSPQIPFDSSKLPRQSALKAGLPPSPINPFYARKLRLRESYS